MKAVVQSETRYYKYTYATFTQPTLTSNTSAAPYFLTDRYNVFDGNTSTGYNVYSAYNQPNCTTNITLNVPTKFTSVTATQARDGEDSKKGINYILYASKDGTNFIEIFRQIEEMNNVATYNLTTSDYYNYYRFYASSIGGYDNDRINFREISFTGEQRSSVEGTAQDYDYMVEGGKTSIIKKNEDSADKYYALKTFEKGIKQYYGGN